MPSLGPKSNFLSEVKDFFLKESRIPTQLEFVTRRFGLHAMAILCGIGSTLSSCQKSFANMIPDIDIPFGKAYHVPIGEHRSLEAENLNKVYQTHLTFEEYPDSSWLYLLGDGDQADWNKGRGVTPNAAQLDQIQVGKRYNAKKDRIEYCGYGTALGYRLIPETVIGQQKAYMDDNGKVVETNDSFTYDDLVLSLDPKDVNKAGFKTEIFVRPGWSYVNSTLYVDGKVRDTIRVRYPNRFTHSVMDGYTELFHYFGGNKTYPGATYDIKYDRHTGKPFILKRDPSTGKLSLRDPNSNVKPTKADTLAVKSFRAWVNAFNNPLPQSGRGMATPVNDTLGSDQSTSLNEGDYTMSPEDFERFLQDEYFGKSSVSPERYLPRQDENLN